MYIKEYSKKKDGEKNITPNIKVYEVACKDGSDYIKINYPTVCIAQYARDVYNKALHCNSAYRTVSHNQKEGGASNSKHLTGEAMDVWIQVVKQQDLANLFYSMGLIRVGVYGSFVHFDTSRTPKWLSQGNFKKVNVPFLNVIKESKERNYLAAIIQYKLNCIGYSCGSEDGIFGNKTLEAVKKYQTNNNLIVDGVVGKNTWNRLFN